MTSPLDDTAQVWRDLGAAQCRIADLEDALVHIIEFAEIKHCQACKRVSQLATEIANSPSYQQRLAEKQRVKT